MEITVKNKYLFNFAVSYMSGGLKRLHGYAKWFNEHGGAWFIIHPQCEFLISEFENNRYFVARQARHERLFNDCVYLTDIREEIGMPDLYYSYGIPIYAKFGKVNWFHLSNVLPLCSKGIPLSLFDRIKLKYLGSRIKNNYHNADVIASDSPFSLSLVKIKETEKLFLSLMGSDDELFYFKNSRPKKKENIATVVGTQKYKALQDSYHIFEMLRTTNRQLKLVLIGSEKDIPNDLRANNDIIIKGALKRNDVIEYLRGSKYYISNTCIEGSYNAAAEGVLLADESYISDIEPHRDLLENIRFERVSVPNMNGPALHVKREDMSVAHLKTWEDIITDLVNQVGMLLRKDK